MVSYFWFKLKIQGHAMKNKTWLCTSGFDWIMKSTDNRTVDCWSLTQSRGGDGVHIDFHITRPKMTLPVRSGLQDCWAIAAMATGHFVHALDHSGLQAPPTGWWALQWTNDEITTDSNIFHIFITCSESDRPHFIQEIQHLHNILTKLHSTLTLLLNGHV